MVEEHTNQPLSRGKSRRERVEHARSRDILDVANELHMELVRSGRDYRWKEHDSMVISPDKNMWNWFSRHQGGDVIALVQTMKEINFNQAIDYLYDGAFKEFAAAGTSIPAAFDNNTAASVTLTNSSLDLSNSDFAEPTILNASTISAPVVPN